MTENARFEGGVWDAERKKKFAQQRQRGPLARTIRGRAAGEESRSVARRCWNRSISNRPHGQDWSRYV